MNARLRDPELARWAAEHFRPARASGPRAHELLARARAARTGRTSLGELALLGGGLVVAVGAGYLGGRLLRSWRQRRAAAAAAAPPRPSAYLRGVDVLAWR